MSCDRTGEHYFAAPNQVGDRRGTSLAIAVSVTISATILLLIGSTIIPRAATIEEVARCRAIQIKKQQWDCFKSLKAPKQNAPQAKRDDTRQSQKEDVPKVQTARCRPKVRADVPKVQTEDVEGADGGRPKVQNGEDVPTVRSEDAQPVPSEVCKQRRMTLQALRPLIISTSQPVSPFA